MLFGCGVSAAASAELAVREALKSARELVPSPKLALVFLSASYEDVDIGARATRTFIGEDVPVLGGTAGGAVHARGKLEKRGASVILLGGDDLDVAYTTAPSKTASLVEAVPAAEALADAAARAAQRGFPHHTCLVFGPGVFVDGEALVAAARKGVGAHAQLAGGLTGDDLTMDRSRAFANDELRRDRVAFAGLFTKKPVGVAARHGFRAVGPERTITRSDGMLLLELDGRPALDVWLEDVRATGATPPEGPAELALYLACHYEIGFQREVVSGPDPDIAGRELIARAPFAIREDGALQMSASIPEGAHCNVMSATTADMIAAAERAAIRAVQRAGGDAAGAFVFPCAGRLVALADAMETEQARVHAAIGAPTAGACVFGEIVRGPRESDAFFNTTLGVVAFPR